MKISIQCPICKLGVNKRKSADEIKFIGESFSPTPNTDNNVLKPSCIHHNYVMFLDNTKFDLLFESGLLAMKDLYFREAVATIAASLERFYEFCLNVLLASDHLDKDELKNVWSMASRQSERQLGAFIFLYFKEFNSKPLILDSDEVSFRNKVIHKGYFPNKDETRNFVLSATKIMLTTYKQMIEKKGAQLTKVREEYTLETESIAQESILNIKKTCGYDPKSKHRVVLHPFKRTLPTFLSTIERRDLNFLEDLNKYIENPMDLRI